MLLIFRSSRHMLQPFSKSFLKPRECYSLLLFYVCYSNIVVKQSGKKKSLEVLLRFLLTNISAKLNLSHVMGIFLCKQDFSNVKTLRKYTVLPVHIQYYYSNLKETMMALTIRTPT